MTGEQATSAIKELSIYELTDGERTSTDFSGWEPYFDGGLFITRMCHFLSILGSRHLTVLTTGEGHKARDNYPDILKALKICMDFYSNNLPQYKMKFIINQESLNSHEKEFVEKLRKIEEKTAANNGDFTEYVLINYSTDWAITHPNEFGKLPNSNVIVKHTKGQVNDGLWLPGKLKGNSFCYVQQASTSVNWTDDEIIALLAIALRTMILHKGLQYAKQYENEAERNYIRQEREIKMHFVHEKLTKSPRKRIVIFSHLGPEIYEF